MTLVHYVVMTENGIRRRVQKVIFRYKHDSSNPSAGQASGAGSADSAERIENLVFLVYVSDALIVAYWC